MDDRPNHIERVARRLLSEGDVDDEVEAYRVAVSILLAARRPRAKPLSEDVEGDEVEDSNSASPDLHRPP